jgi:hypothetical protein
MLNITTKIDAEGFWYLLETNQEVSYSFYYFALGSQGKFCSGKIEGNTALSDGWQFCRSSFPIIHLGITSINISESKSEEDAEHESSDEHVHIPADISRRKMINQTISALLIGGTFLPSLLERNTIVQKKNSPYTSPYTPYQKPPMMT